MRLSLASACGTAPVLFSVEVERKFQTAPHADRLAILGRRIKSDLPSSFDGFARQAVGQSADNANVLHFAIAAKNGLQNHSAFHTVDPRDLRVFRLLPI